MRYLIHSISFYRIRWVCRLPPHMWRTLRQRWKSQGSFRITSTYVENTLKDPCSDTPFSSENNIIFNQFLSTKNRMLHHTLAKQKTKYNLMIFCNQYLILYNYYLIELQFFYS